MPRASRICASTKWPIRHFAITGIVTAAMIDLISSGSDMRATPPSLRMSAGTRSSAITAQAPASWAIRACSAVTTSMITPPFSICASPALTLKEPFTDPFPLRTPLRSATLEILRGRVGIAAPAHPPPPRIVRTIRNLARPIPRLVRTIRPASEKLEALQDQGSLGGVLVVGKQAVAMQPRQHVHLLEHVQQRRHGPPGQVRVRSGACLLTARVELAHEEERFDS